MDDDEKKSNIISFRRFKDKLSRLSLKRNDASRSDRFSWNKDDVEHHPDNDDVRESTTHALYNHLVNMDHDSMWYKHVHEHVMSDGEHERFRNHWRDMKPDDREEGINYKRFSGDTNHRLRTSTNHMGGRLVNDPKQTYTGPWARAKRYADKIASLERVTNIPTHEDMTVYRGVAPQSSKFYSFRPGHHFTDHGFTGTSLRPEIAADFGSSYSPPESHDFDPKVPEHLRSKPHSVLAKIHVPAGTLGHYLDVPGGVEDEHQHHYEKEFLLHRGTRFRIDGHEKIGSPHYGFGTHLIHMTVVGQHPKKLHFV